MSRKTNVTPIIEELTNTKIVTHCIKANGSIHFPYKKGGGGRKKIMPVVYNALAGGLPSTALVQTPEPMLRALLGSKHMS